MALVEWHVSSKILQGSETEKRELLEGAKENHILPSREESLIFSSGKSRILCKKSKQNKIALVARPGGATFLVAQ